MKNMIPSLLLISAVTFLSGCQCASQKYQVVKTSDLLKVIDEQFHFALIDHERFRKVSLAYWNCYVPDDDDKIDDVFFCADGNRVVTLNSSKPRPRRNPESNQEPLQPPAEDHTHPDSEVHTHHD